MFKKIKVMNLLMLSPDFMFNLIELQAFCGNK